MHAPARVLVLSVSVSVLVGREFDSRQGLTIAILPRRLSSLPTSSLDWKTSSNFKPFAISSWKISIVIFPIVQLGQDELN